MAKPNSMMSKPNSMMTNIVAFNNDSVGSRINNYINELAINSPKTMQSYKRNIEQFFDVMRNKRIEELTESDILFTNSDIKQYKILISTQYSTSSINQKLSSIKSLFVELAKDYPDINTNVFSVKKVKGESNGYAVLYWEEVQEMMDCLKEKRASDENKQKIIMLELATRTSIRLSALCGVHLCDISRVRDKNYYVVRVIDKGHKVDEKPIPESLYKEILLLKRGFTDRIFTLSERTFERMVKELSQEIGIEPERNVTFHSLKKVGVQWVLENTNDITLAALQGNHSNIQTTHKAYVDMQKHAQMESLAGLNLGNGVSDKEFEDVLNGLDKQTLIDVLKSLEGSARVQVIKRVMG